MQRVSCDEAGLERASEVVSSGGVVVYPTDTVYGIGCDPYNADAVKKVYDIKGRDYGTPVPVLAGSIRDIERIAHIDEASRRIASSLWPGRVTLILRLADSEIKESLMLDSDKIAVRIPGGACICGLLGRCGLIVGTSANRSGTGPFTEADACYDGITGFDLFLDGGLIRDGGASTIAECADGRLHIHREGSVGRASLEALF